MDGGLQVHLRSSGPGSHYRLRAHTRKLDDDLFRYEPISITASNERITVGSDIAWIACTETISLMLEEGLAAAAAQATNIFRRTGDQWRMVLHHASPIPFETQDEWPDVIN